MGDPAYGASSTAGRRVSRLKAIGGVRFSNPAMFLPQKPEDFRGFQRGWSIAQVARFGESGARESRFRLPSRLRIRQPMRENRGNLRLTARPTGWEKFRGI